MTWTKLTDYAITNGKHLISNQGRDNEYKHGTHIISKQVVGDVIKYKLWECGSPDKMMGFFTTVEEAKRWVDDER